jgi:hypothetical protein
MQSMRVLGIIVLLFLMTSCSKPIDRIRTKIGAVEEIAAADASVMAGIYVQPGPSYAARAPGSLGGNYLYLFPDGTYIYSVWTDSGPSTRIHDQGTWKLSGKAIRLTSDPEIAWDPLIDRRLFAIRRTSKPNEVLLIGLDSDLLAFEKQPAMNSEITFLGYVRERYKPINSLDAADLKSSLMKVPLDPR